MSDRRCRVSVDPSGGRPAAIGKGELNKKGSTVVAPETALRLFEAALNVWYP